MKITTFIFGKNTWNTIKTTTVIDGYHYSKVPEVTMDTVLETYQLAREWVQMVVDQGGGHLVLSRYPHLANGKLWDLELKMSIIPFKGKLTCEVLMDVFIPETKNYTAGIDFQQVDRFNILL